MKPNFGKRSSAGFNNCSNVHPISICSWHNWTSSWIWTIFQIGLVLISTPGICVMTPGKPSYSIDGNDSQVHSSIYIIKWRRVSKLSLWQTNTFSWSRSREIDLISPDCQTVGFYFLKEVGSGGGGLSADQLFANNFFLVIHPLFSNLFGIEHRSVIVVGIITKQYQVSTPSSGKMFKPFRFYGDTSATKNFPQAVLPSHHHMIFVQWQCWVSFWNGCWGFGRLPMQWSESVSMNIDFYFFEGLDKFF